MIDSTYIKVHRDGANPAGGQEHQALILTAGTEADVVHAPALLESVEARQVLMDKAYDSDALRELIQDQGMQPCIPPRSNRVAPAAYDQKLYKKRHQVENFFEKIKRMRRIATRYDKTDVSFMAFVVLAICSLSLRNPF